MTIIIEVSSADSRAYSTATGGLSITDGLISVPVGVRQRILRSRLTLVDKVHYGEVEPDSDLKNNGDK